MSGWPRITMLLLPLALGGCGLFGGSNTRTPLGSETFLRPSVSPAPTPVASPSADERRQAADASGLLSPGVVRGVMPDAGGPRQPSAQSVREISPAVREVVTAPPAATSAAPSSTPAATRAGEEAGGITTGQYLTVGAVVTEVSGTPIYADKVIQQLSPLLSSEAKQRDPQSYKAMASREITKQIDVMIRTELEYAAAVQNLGKDEKQFADNLTTQWRQRQITEAGGSVELARRKAAADGMDFDEKVREQYRTYFVQIFYQKKVYPRVQVSAQDMRKYYDQHLKTDFTEADQAQFRLIKITAANMGGRDRAIDKIKELHDQTVHMNDQEFAKLAGSINHDPMLMKSAGRVGGTDGWVQRGAFAIQQIEDAVWKLQPGQVSDVIEIGNSFYIARLENRKLGRVRPFEDEDVQKQIGDTLRREQIARQREQVQEKLMKDAVIYPYPPVIDPALEIAMQKYPQWAMAR